MIGKRLGHFEIVEKIGAGGMGEIYRAHDQHLDRDVALKVLPTRTSLAPSIRKRFRKEALTLAKLKHAHIGAVYDFGAEDGIEFLVLELIPGTDLSATLGDGALSESETVRLGIQIAEALEEAHEQNIVHLDLKPQNVMVTPKGQAKVLDFGLAKLVRPVDEVSTASLSEVQSVAGTLPYMAPEQLREGAELDARTDVYALGVTLYEMAAGNRPFQQTDAGTLITAILKTTPPSLRETATDVSGDLDRIVQKALQKDPAQRYQTVKELREDLQRCQAGTPVAAPRLGRRRFDRRAVFALAALVVILAGSFGLNIGGIRDRIAPVRGEPHIASLAVLPLRNLTGDPNQNHVVDGITEMLIARLNGIDRIVVYGRHSAFRYDANETSPSEFAAGLGVSNLVQGSVMRSGQRVVIQVELTEAASDRVLWADDLDRDMSELSLAMRDITADIARGVAVTLTPADEALLARPRPINPRAHETYLEGWYLFRGFNEGDAERIVESFERAIAIDSTYAPAYAGIALVHAFGWSMGGGGYSLQAARAAAQTALGLDSTLADAHLSMGWINAGEWDWEGADRSFRRALELDPDSPFIHENYGIYLLNIGRYEESLYHKKRAHELDPLWKEQGWAIVYIFQNRLEEARNEFESYVESLPGYHMAHALLGAVYFKLKDYEKAIAAFERAVELGELPYTVSLLAQAYGTAGRMEEAHAALGRLEEIAERAPVSGVYFAMARIGLGQTDEALTLLEQAVETRDSALIQLPSNWVFDPVRSEPRFQAVLRRMNLRAS